MRPKLCVVMLLFVGLALGFVAVTPDSSEAGPVWRWVMRGHDRRVEHRVAKRASRRAQYSASVSHSGSYGDCGRSAAATYSDCGRSNAAQIQVQPTLPESPGVGDNLGPVAPPFRATSANDVAKATSCRCGPNCTCGPDCQCNAESKELDIVIQQAVDAAIKKYNSEKAIRAKFET